MDVSSVRERKDYGYGFGPDPTLPRMPEPPENDVLAAMRSVPGLLCLPLSGRADYRAPYPVHFLLALLLEGGQRPNCDASKAHGEAAAQWAIRCHIQAGRLVETEGHVRPHDSLWEWWRESAAVDASAGSDTSDDAQPPNKASHSPDFRAVNWYGESYSFTGNQAACIKLLWEAWENDAPDVGGETLLQAADAITQRLDAVFRNCSAWGAKIVQGGTKGSYRLTEPTPRIPKPAKRKAKETSRRT